MLASLSLVAPWVSAAGVYRCPDARGGLTYMQAPCAGGDSVAMAVDRAGPFPGVSGAPRPDPSRTVVSPQGHRLTPAELERLERLRGAQSDAPSEARTASEIEIAAIREGADTQLSSHDRRLLESLRPELSAADRETRLRALDRWRSIYSTYRAPARPHSTGGETTFTRSIPGAVLDVPLGADTAGSRGPLVGTPQSPAIPLPTRPTVAADPNTGRVLASVGSDRLVDPVTGAIWMRSGPLYVDPASGRIIPAP
ncbi:MAG: hypothetical protein M3Z31_04470 [Pseudomonadota bacterium]|nr:hypothetical protein [Pseudomonadota bacterium]